MRSNILCAYCGKKKNYPDDFPVVHYAKCKNCFEQDEIKHKGSLKFWALVAWLLKEELGKKPFYICEQCDNPCDVERKESK